MNIGAPGSEDRKKFYAVCAFTVVAVVYLYVQFFRDSSPPAAPPPPPVIVTVPASSAAAPAGIASAGTVSAANPAPSGPIGPAAKLVGTTTASLDPTLHPEAMLVTESVTYSGSGRNIFSAVSAPPVVIPKPITPARLIVTPPPPLPCPPNCPPPPPPPPIDLKFCGYFESPITGAKRAILLHGEDQFLASPGDVVMRRYRILNISSQSVQVEDIPNSNKQNLPLLAN
jgi:hypothetical protein